MNKLIAQCNTCQVWWILLLMMPLSAMAQLELYGKFNTNGTIDPIINYYGSKKISTKFSVTFFGLVRQTWSQALIGTSYKLTPDITLSASIGIEHGQHMPRYSASLFVNKGKNTYVMLGELGSGYQNYLYKISIFHQFSKNISAGVMDWRYHGLGLNFRYAIQPMESTIWIMPAYDHEQKVVRYMIGFSVNM